MSARPDPTVIGVGPAPPSAPARRRTGAYPVPNPAHPTRCLPDPLLDLTRCSI